MKTFIALLLLVLFVAAPAGAQVTPQQAALAKRGTVKVWTGISLIGAGAFVLPITAADRDQTSWAAPASSALMFTGGSLAWFGFRDRRKAISPSTTFGVTVGRVTAVQVRRAW
jgi:hypothetical protein